MSKPCQRPDAVLSELLRVVSGGQTGVDRAGLDAAIALGIEHGGWCPKGRLAEDGVVPSRYSMEETESPAYTARTEQNVVYSDATLILYTAALSGGTALTYRIAKRHGKPCLLVPIDQKWSIAEVRDWITQTMPQTLNIAGPRESSRPGIYQMAFQAVLRILEPRTE